MSIEDFIGKTKKEFKILKPIRLIELFSGVGAQASALERLKVPFEHWRTSDWEVNAVASYNAIHIKDNTNYSVPFTDTQLTDHLYGLGISTDGKNPLTKKQIKRKSEKWKREVFNNFQATNNIGSIVNAHAADLKIVDTDKYTYLLTYSFPCQDLSVAGKQAGMTKGSGTRSGMLWEVERLLYECEQLPQVLIMENVPQAHGKKFKDDFNKWIGSLENLGYTNYWQDLNAKDFSIPQNRERVFCVSIYRGEEFVFPRPVDLKTSLYDMLEKDAPDKYYLRNGQVLKNPIKQEVSYCLDSNYWKGVTLKSFLKKHRRQLVTDKIDNNGFFVPRRLTPRECWRLMGFTDEEFQSAEQVNSNTQLYKQAGNSIVVNVLVAIIGQMIPGHENDYKNV